MLTLADLKSGTRVQFSEDVGRYPHFIVPKGTTGTVKDVSGEGCAILMDQAVEGAESWDNEFLVTLDDQSENDSIFETLKIQPA